MSSITGLQGVVLATAMAVSGTAVLLVLRLQKSLPGTEFPVDQIAQSSQPILRSCIPTEGKIKKSEKKKKRVHFAEDVVEPRGDGEEFRRKHGITNNLSSASSTSPPQRLEKSGAKIRGMPANRAALYNGILRDRVVQRLACSY